MMKRLRELSGYLAGEPLFPIVVLFLLNAVDEFDSRTFEVLGPEIADHFNISVSRFGLITILVVFLVPFVSVPVSLPRRPHASACRSPSRGPRCGARSPWRPGSRRRSAC